MNKRTLLLLVSAAATAFCQDVVSARAGMINHIEGTVSVNGKAVTMPDREKMFSSFPEVKNGAVLATTEGRAEVLLSPGVVLRVGEDSSFRMINASLSDTRIELVSGAAVVDVAELLKENTVTIAVGGYLVLPRRTGTYKLEAGENAHLKVYEGQAELRVASAAPGGEAKMVKRGNAVALTAGAPLVAQKFDTDKGDALTRWSLRRASYVAMANISAASYAKNAGLVDSTGSWRWNPYFGMFTYLPFRGSACSSFSGLCFYSPAHVYRAFYTPPADYNGGGFVGRGGPSYSYNQDMGAIGASQRSYGGYNNVGMAGGAPVSAPAVSAPAAPSGDAGGMRGGDGATGRGGSGGGRSQ